MWPSVAIYFLAIVCLWAFISYSQRILKENDEKLSEKFDSSLPCRNGHKKNQKNRPFYIRVAFLLSEARWFSIPRWRDTTECENAVAKLWQEYRTLGGLRL